jgi:hypothetical protein
VVWLIPTLLALHNAEEAIAFRRMWTHIPALLPEPFASLEARVPYEVMLQALVVLSILGFLLAAVVIARPESRAALWLLLALEAAIAINVVAHVVSAIIVFKGYGPGLATALLLNGPFAWYALRRARDDGWMSRRAWRALAFGGLMLHGPVLIGALWLLARLQA